MRQPSAISRGIGRWARLLALSSIATVSAFATNPLQDARLDVLPNGETSLNLPAAANHYFVLYGGGDLEDVSRPFLVQYGSETSATLKAASLVLPASPLFFKVVLVPVDFPIDTDNDGINDLYELQRTQILDPLDRNDAVVDSDGDGATNRQEARIGTNPNEFDEFPARIASLSPADGDDMVSADRHPKIRFDKPIDPATIDDTSVQLLARGKQLSATIDIAPSGRIVTLMPDDALPSLTDITLVVDGNAILDTEGNQLDADGDLQAGGSVSVRFRTLPLVRIAGTRVFGYVRDSVSGAPIEGAIIHVDAFPAANTTTDGNGRFELVDMPAPEFFVHIVGQTATGIPEGFTYPIIGKPFHSVAGKTVQIAADGQPFDVYLPLMATSDATDLSATSATPVGFGANAKQQLAVLYPEMDTSLWDQVSVEFPAGAAINDDGDAVTQGLLLPVPPDRIPAPLPPYLTPTLVISVQAPGATRFSQPAPVTFPNVENLPPNSKTLIMSFDHDAGKWIVAATATVSADGTLVTSDPGQGILAPGWHITQPGSPPGYPDPDDDCEDIDSLDLLEEWWDTQAKELECLLELLPADALTKGPKLALQALSKTPDLIDALEVMATNPPEGDPEGIDALLKLILGSKGLILEALDVGAAETPVGKFLSITSCLIGLSKEVIEFGCTLGTCFLNPNDQAYQQYCQDLTNAITALETLSKNVINIMSFSEGGPAAEAACAALDSLESIIGLIPSSIGATTPIGAARLFANPTISLTQTERNQIMQTAQQAIEAVEDWQQEIQVLIEWGEAVEDVLDAYAAYSDNVISPIASRAKLFRDSYYHVSIAGQDFYGRSTSLGEFDLPIFAPDSEYTFDIFDPARNNVARASGISAGAGETTSIPDPRIVLPYRDGYPDDTDGDGLDDLRESIVGTSIDDPDSDGDGVPDGAEIANGLNPLDGVGLNTGIVGAVALSGEAYDIAIANDIAYVATSSFGMAVVDVSEPDIPVVLAELDLPGNSRSIAVDPATQTVAVASSTDNFFRDLAHIRFFDVSDPAEPTLIREQPLNNRNLSTLKVAFSDGVFYVNDEGHVNLFEAATTAQIAAVDTGILAINDLAASGGLLFVMDGANLKVYDARPAHLAFLGSVNTGMRANQRGFRPLATDGTRVYVGGSQGYVVVSVADPTQPVLLSPFPGTQATTSPNDLVLCGSNRLLQVVPTGPISLFDSSDPAVVDDFMTSFTAPSTAPRGIAINRNRAYVATDSKGLTVINYLGVDLGDAEPEIAFSPESIDAEPELDGIQAIEGERIHLHAFVSDDVQVASFEAFLNGVSQGRHLDGVTESRIRLPLIDDGAPTATIQLRATDTGGNTSWSPEYTVELLPNDEQSFVALAAPSDNGATINPVAVVLLASIEVDPATIDGEKISLRKEGDVEPLAGTIVGLADGRFITIDLPTALAPGQYTLTVEADAWTSRTGKPNTETTIDFISYDLFANTAVWTSKIDGGFHDPSNWMFGVLPTPTQAIYIDVPDADPVVTFDSGFGGTGAVEIHEKLIVDSSWTLQGPFHAMAEVEFKSGSVWLFGAQFEAPVTLSGSRLVLYDDTTFQDFTTTGGTLVLDGSETDLVIEGTIAQGDFSIEAVDGAVVSLPWVTSLGADTPTGLAIKADGAGSRVELPNLASLVAPDDSGFFAKNFLIFAWRGGEVSLPQLSDVGAAGRVNLSARYSDGRISLPSLASLPGPTNGPAASIEARDTGMIDFGTNAISIGNATIGLSNAGKIVASSVTIEADSTLTSDGAIEGALINDGTITLSSANGISVSGAYTQSATGTLKVAIGIGNDPAKFGFLQVTGAATIDGALVVQPANGYTPADGHESAFLTHASRSGNFSSVTGDSLNGGLKATLSNDATTTKLTVTTP